MTKTANPKRQSILAAAKRAFLAQGYSGTSMDMIAEATPVSKSTLYSHFSSKQSLFSAVIAAQGEDLQQTLSRIRTERMAPKACLATIARAFVDLIYAKESLDIYRLVVYEQRNFPDLGQLIYRSAREPLLRQLSAHLADWNARDLLRVADVEISCQLFLGMLQGNIHFRCLMGLQEGLSDAEKARLVDSAVALFIKGYAPRDGVSG